MKLSEFILHSFHIRIAFRFENYIIDNNTLSSWIRCIEEEKMAKNTGKGYRQGPVDDRSQTQNPRTGQFVKRDAATGKFIDVKQDGTPFKGVRKEKK
jgi:hypothetical protein